MPHENGHPVPDPNEELTRLAFSMYGSRGVYALLLGSGLSRGAGIPTGWDITLDLVRRLALVRYRVEDGATDWLGWYRDTFGKEPDYSDLITHLGPSAHERRAILHGYIEPTEEDLREGRKVPTKAHHAIAGLVHDGFVRVILTTNFDRLLENALRESGVEPTVIDSIDALAGAEPLAHTKCYLVKLHGDYKDARILNTDGELASYPAEYESLLGRILDEHGLVICGWSGDWDEALRRAIMSNPSRRYSLFWASRGTPGEAAERIVAHRRGHFVPIADADGFFSELRDQVQTLARTHRRNPESVELLIERTKQFAAAPVRRIELHDLVESEVGRLLRALNESEPRVEASTNEVQLLTTYYESVTEPLARMFGVLGMWADGSEHDIVVNTVLTLWRREGGTVSRLVHLRCYPAVLLLWTYGTGLTLRRRWGALHRVLSHSFDGDHGRQERLVGLVSKWILEGNDNRLWTHLPGVENHRTPAFDHLYRKCNIWRDSYAAVVADFESIHDIWEILFALTYCEPEAMEGRGKRGSHYWVPIGRSGLRHMSRSRVLERIEKGDLRQELLDAGFGGGQQEQLSVVIAHYVEFIRRLGWW